MCHKAIHSTREVPFGPSSGEHIMSFNIDEICVIRTNLCLLKDAHCPSTGHGLAFRSCPTDMDSGRGAGSLQMPAELQEMYDLYTQEVHGANGQRNTRFLNELNEILRVRGPNPRLTSAEPDNLRPKK